MPISQIDVRLNKYKSLESIITKKDLKYSYPINPGINKPLDLKPGSKLHSKLKNLVTSYANDSSDAISRKRHSWKLIERTLTSYIPLSDAEQAVKDDDSRKPIRIVIPVSFATLETFLTYWVGAFLRDPYFKYEGYGPEDTAGAMLLQASIQQQAIHSRMGLALHTWWRDGLSAGFGAATPMWHKSAATRIIKKKLPPNSGGNILSRAAAAFMPKQDEFEEVEVPAWEGSVLHNIDYRNFLPDPTVPVYDQHKAEAAGWIRRSNYVTMLEEELADPDNIFNIKYLKDTDGTSALFDEESSTGRSESQGGVGISTGNSNRVGTLDTIYKYIKLIPADYGLSDSENPEVWLIALTADQVITQCRRYEHDHGDIPIVVNAPDYDGHTLLPNSRLETIYGLQQFMDWSFNSMIANQRKSLNDMFVVDPSLVNMYDLANPGPGKLIRLRRSVFGRGVNDAVKQLQVNDVTSNNMNNVAFAMDLINRTSAAADSVQGLIRKGSERRSAAEFQGTMGSALSRIEKTARITWLQGMLPLQRMLAEDTQQFMSGEQYARINSEYQKQIINTFGQDAVFESSPGNFKAVIDKKRLSYNYDIIPHDGSMPGAGDPQVWQQVLQTVGSNELLSGKLDVFKIFKHFAEISGAKNIEDFAIKQQTQLQPQVQPDEEVAQQVQAGNYIPIGG